MTKYVDIHSTCTQESVHEQCIHVYTWNVYSKRRLERVYVVQISIDCELKFSSITNKLITKLLSSFDFAWFFKIKCRHKWVDTVLYASDTCSVPCLTAALHLARNIQLPYALFCCTLYIYIVHVCTAVNY